jgi:hypothetical protein
VTDGAARHPERNRTDCVKGLDVQSLIGRHPRESSGCMIASSAAGGLKQRILHTPHARRNEQLPPQCYEATCGFERREAARTLDLPLGIASEDCS